MGWHLNAVQFMTLWEATDLDRMPYPLRYRTTAVTEEVQSDETRALHAWRSSSKDDGLADCITALRYPDLSVTVYGRYGDDCHIRRRGCLKDGVAVLAEQVSTPDGNGDILVSVRDDGITRNRAALALELVGELPACLAGRIGQMTAHPDDIAPRTGTSILQSTVDSPGVAIRRLLSQPRAGVGYICIRGPRAGLTEPLVDEFSWIDVVGDGRYVHRVADYVSLFPASPGRLYEELLHRMTAAH